MRHRLRRQTTAILTAAALLLGSTALTFTNAAAEPPTDPVGGKTVVGQTSPIHDPALIIADDGTWYVYSTGLINRENGGTIQIWTSTDAGTTWAYSGTVWDQIPSWIDDHYAGGALPDNLWAPEIYEHNGTYYLYYSASRFGTDNSITALATNTTLDPTDPNYEWVDQGPVITSPVTGLPGGKLFNAIDAGIVEDAAGNPYMAIGSFWYGIFLVPLEWPSGKPVADWQSQTVHIADRFMAGNPIEAPYITKHDGYYYLFVSFGYCCRAADSTYQVAVGRSTSLTGPYLDEAGRDMFGGGGTILLDKAGAIVGPGGQSVFGDYLAFHYYDAANPAIPYFPTLGIQKLDWVDGWPVTNQTVELPAITQGPVAATVTAGSSATFTTTASGVPAPVAVWETSQDGGVTWGTVSPQPKTTPPATPASDAATSTLDLTAVTAAQDGLLIRATVSNAHGRVTTEPVALTVKTPTVVDPTTDPSEAPTTSTTTAAGVATSTAGVTVPTAGGSTLAQSGSDATGLALGALLLGLLGAGAFTMSRRRSQQD